MSIDSGLEEVAMRPDLQSEELGECSLLCIVGRKDSEGMMAGYFLYADGKPVAYSFTLAALRNFGAKLKKNAVYHGTDGELSVEEHALIPEQ